MAKASMPDLGQAVQIPTFEEFSRPGVYFLYRGGVVVYVGQSTNMRRRIGDHMVDGLKIFDAVGCIPCDPANLNKVEAKFIRRLTPEYNRCIPANQARHLNAIRPAAEAKLLSGPITARTAAEYLGITPEELLELERQGGGPKRVRVPRRNVRRYTLTGLRAWVEARAVAS